MKLRADNLERDYLRVKDRILSGQKEEKVFEEYKKGL